MLSLDLQCDDGQDTHDLDLERESPLMGLPYGNAEPEAAIPDEDIQAGITDDVLAQVQFAERCRKSSTLHLQITTSKCSTVRLQMESTHSVPQPGIA